MLSGLDSSKFPFRDLWISLRSRLQCSTSLGFGLCHLLLRSRWFVIDRASKCCRTMNASEVIGSSRHIAWWTQQPTCSIKAGWTMPSTRLPKSQLQLAMGKLKSVESLDLVEFHRDQECESPVAASVVWVLVPQSILWTLQVTIPGKQFQASMWAVSETSHDE